MTTITTADGTQIYYKGWGTGQPVVFSHGWPLSADAWDDQMVFLAERGYRCIAHDRRGHGRSSQPWQGNDMDTYADDLAALVAALDLRNAVHVGHSTGGGEVARYIGRHGTAAGGQGCADRRLSHALRQARQGLDAENLSGLRPWHVLDAQGPDQRRSAGVPQGISAQTLSGVQSLSGWLLPVPHWHRSGRGFRLVVDHRQVLTTKKSREKGNQR